MNTGKRNTARKVLCLVLAVLILGSLVSGALIMTVGAASSKEIEKELVALREEQAELKKQSDALQTSINENQAKTQTLVEKKADIDQQMEMSRQTIENLNEQIQQYSLLIAQKQDELEQTEAEEARLNKQYKTRLRAMEETGKISYWSILFGASSFSDLLDKVNMINEIAESDKLMLQKMADVAAQISSERADLETQMDELEQAKSDLAEQQTALETQRAESDQLILQMSAEYDSLSEEYQNYEKLEDEMSAQIKKTETEYFNALSKEEAARQAELNRQKMADVAAQISSERADLETQMDELEQAKSDLAEQQTALETQRAESDQLILQMSAEYDSLSEEYQNYEKLEDEMSAQIKKTETEYFNALSKEEAARQAELNRQNNNKVPSNGSSNSGSSSSTGGFLYPLPYAVPITDAYGYRIHPLSGTYKWHNGVDLAAGSGTAIYATKSGTVTSACYNEAYGYMVTINHADGYSSLYGHMTNYTVSAGDYVTQGQTIGYVGSTGWSTGPHLHFTIYYNGADVNPMNYVSMP